MESTDAKRRRHERKPLSTNANVTWGESAGETLFGIGGDAAGNEGILVESENRILT